MTTVRVTAAALVCAAIGWSGAIAARQQRPFEDIVRELAHHEPRVRVAAMRSLAAAGHPEAIGHIARLLVDPVDEIQIEAIETILRFYLATLPSGTRRVGGIIEVSGAGAAERAFEAGPFVVLPRPVPDALSEAIAGAMRDDQVRIRRDATYVLGVVARPPVAAVAQKALVANLGDPYDEVRLAAARVAGAVRAGATGDALVAAINDPEERVRLAAMRSVGDLREPRAVRALREQLDFHRRGRFARAALDGLARIADPSSIESFQEHAAGSDPELRRLAIEGIGRLGDAAAIQALEGATLNERDRSVRLARAFALERAGREGLRELVAALGDNRRFELAMAYLVELGPGRVRALGAWLKEPDARIRERLTQVIGLLGGPDAAVLLEPTTRDPDQDVARAADRALARLRMENR